LFKNSSSVGSEQAGLSVIKQLQNERECVGDLTNYWRGIATMLRKERHANVLVGLSHERDIF
jgi:hypothetical protein